MPDWVAYRGKYHTSTDQLAEIANRTKPGILIVYHNTAPDEVQWLQISSYDPRWVLEFE